MRSCFIPNCDSRNKHRHTRPFFNVPKDPKLFAIWKEALPKKRELKHSDKVCVDHFDDSHLITNYETIVNGKKVVIPRGRPKLSENAIPFKYLTDCDYPKRGRKCGMKYAKTKSENCEITLKKIELKRVKVKRSSNLNDKSCDIIIQSTEDPFAEEIEEILNELCEEEKMKNGMVVDVVKTVLNAEREKIDESNTEINVEQTDTNYEENVDMEFAKQQKEIFNNLYEDIFEVELPSTLWAIHRDPSNNFIAFTYFHPILHLSSKSIILYNNLKADIILFNKRLSDKDLSDRCSIEDIGNILKEVDNIRLCSSNKELHTSCELTLSKNDESICKTCLEEEFSE